MCNVKNVIELKNSNKIKFFIKKNIFFEARPTFSYWRLLDLENMSRTFYYHVIPNHKINTQSFQNMFFCTGTYLKKDYDSLFLYLVLSE